MGLDLTWQAAGLQWSWGWFLLPGAYSPILGLVSDHWWMELFPGVSGYRAWRAGRGASRLVGRPGPRVSGCRALGLLKLVSACWWVGQGLDSWLQGGGSRGLFAHTGGWSNLLGALVAGQVLVGWGSEGPKAAGLLVVELCPCSPSGLA